MEKKCSRRGKFGRACDHAVDSLLTRRQQGGYNGTGWSVNVKEEGPEQTIRANDGERFLILHRQQDALILAAQHKRLEEIEHYQFTDSAADDPEGPTWLMDALDSLSAV